MNEVFLRTPARDDGRRRGRAEQRCPRTAAHPTGQSDETRQNWSRGRVDGRPDALDNRGRPLEWGESPAGNNDYEQLLWTGGWRLGATRRRVLMSTAPLSRRSCFPQVLEDRSDAPSTWDVELASRPSHSRRSGVRHRRRCVREDARPGRAQLEDSRLISSAPDWLFHWFHAGRFLTEARRLLQGSGWLVIYNSGFTGEMLEEPAFGGWFREGFLARYPKVRRQPVVITAYPVERTES